LYVEGVHESYLTDDTWLRVDYTDTTGKTETAFRNLTVTPVIKSYYATPGASPNIQFADGATGASGLWATHTLDPFPLRDPGIRFSADVFTGATLSMALVQNVNYKNNANGTGAGLIYQAGTIFANARLNMGLDPSLTTADLPLLDANPRGDITYPTSIRTSTPDGLREILESEDSPFTGIPPSPGSIESFDCLFLFKQYLGVWYSDGSFYPVANLSWQANFFATGGVAGKGPMTIRDRNGVTAKSMMRSNEEPKTSDPKSNGRVDANGNITAVVGWF
jgi:hypothetical protein